MRQLTIKSGQGNYDVDFLGDLLGLTGLLETAPKAVLVLDKNVAQRYSAQLSRLTATLPTLTVPATEEEKTLARVASFLSDPLKSFEATLRDMMATNHLGTDPAPVVHPVVASAAREVPRIEHAMAAIVGNGGRQ